MVTDSKLVPKRRFAFVGYASEDEAAKAKEWFDGSFAFGGGKVKVDFVRDEPLAPKPAKRARTEKDEVEEKPEAGPSKKDSKGLKDFMDVMKGVDVTKVVEDAAVAVPGEAGWVAEGAPGAKEGKKVEEEDEQEDEEDVGDDDDDDAAWLAKRQARTGDDDGEAVSSSHESSPHELTTDTRGAPCRPRGRTHQVNWTTVRPQPRIRGHGRRLAGTVRHVRPRR